MLSVSGLSRKAGGGSRGGGGRGGEEVEMETKGVEDRERIIWRNEEDWEQNKDRGMKWQDGKGE